jgi:hypothetical protein
LRRICGTFGVFPSSFTLPDTLDGHGPEPIATGGFSHVYQTSFKGRPVAVKSLVITAGEERLSKLHRVRGLVWRA